MWARDGGAADCVDDSSLWNTNLNIVLDPWLSKLDSCQRIEARLPAAIILSLVGLHDALPTAVWTTAYSNWQSESGHGVEHLSGHPGALIGSGVVVTAQGGIQWLEKWSVKVKW
jgi:hypothetical protein